MTSGTSAAANEGPMTLPSDSLVALRAAHRNLVPLAAVLVDAENADMADVMVAAGIHAARHVELEIADVVQVVEIVEAPLDRFGDRNRLRVRERAEVAARAADDVGQQADVRRREARGPCSFVHSACRSRLQHVGEHEVLLVRHAHFAERIAVGERRDCVHLARRRVARRHAGALERQRDDRVTAPLVRPDVALGPARERAAVGDRGAERDAVASEVAIGGLA